MTNTTTTPSAIVAQGGMLDKLAAFVALLEKEQNDRVAKQHPILQENALKDGRRGYEEVGIDEGGRFWKVYNYNGSQRSVKYFVERNTGIIFGASSWKKYNPVHEYGTLDTINEWDWSNYYAVNKNGKKSIVPKAERK